MPFCVNSFKDSNFNCNMDYDLDYGRRGSHSDPRRRSRSPVNRRYSNGHDRRQEPRMVDPFTTSELVSYHFFCKWYQSLNPGVEIDDSMQSRYDDYIKDLTARTVKPYVKTQAEFACFRDYYAPEQHNKSLRVSKHAQFKRDLEQGKYTDFSIDAPEGETGYAMTDIVPEQIINVGEASTHILVIKGIPPKVSYESLTQHVESICAIEYISITAPNSTLLRNGWIVLTPTQDSVSALRKLDGSVVRDGDFVMSVTPFRVPVSRRKVMLWSELNDPAQIETHTDTIESIIQLKAQQLDVESIWKSVVMLPAKSASYHLDLGVEYLRQVHFYDYWNLKGYDSPLDLEAHSPGYLRQSGPPQQNYDLWVHQFQQKLSIVLDPASYLRALRQPSLTEHLEAAIQDHVQKEDELRFRCKIPDCTKLFKDYQFVKKHIEKRHVDWIAKVTEEQGLRERYLSDPNRHPPYKVAVERQQQHQQRPPKRARQHSQPQRRVYRDLDAPVEDLPELNY